MGEHDAESAYQFQLQQVAVAGPAEVVQQHSERDDAELVGNYAIRIVFSDGHDTGIYTWDYLLHLAEPTAQDTP